MGEDRQGGRAARGRRPGGRAGGRIRLLAALSLLVVVAGCGGGDDEKAATTTATESAAAAALRGPDGLEKVVARCQVSKVRSPTPDVVPIQLRPRHARVVSVTRTGEGYSARVLYDKSVTAVYAVLRGYVTRTGGQIGRAENEGRDAELEFERNGERTEIALAALRACPQYSQATIRTETAG